MSMNLLSAVCRATGHKYYYIFLWTPSRRPQRWCSVKSWCWVREPAGRARLEVRQRRLCQESDHLVPTPPVTRALGATLWCIFSFPSCKEPCQTWSVGTMGSWRFDTDSGPWIWGTTGFRIWILLFSHVILKMPIKICFEVNPDPNPGF